MVKLTQAQEVAHVIIETIAPACERVSVAGSIRRQKLEVKDVEIVYIPKMVKVQRDLFTFEDRPATEGLFYELAQQGFWRLDTRIKRNGPKYKRFVHTASRMTIETFRADPDNWGLILALRTGPGLFNKLLVNRMGGAMPVDMAMSDGYLWKRGKKLQTPDEAAFFEAIGTPVWSPEQRSLETLERYLRTRR
jgi:DNA polymerase/3'-5' exonuclease PolX